MFRWGCGLSRCRRRRRCRCWFTGGEWRWSWSWFRARWFWSAWFPSNLYIKTSHCNLWIPIRKTIVELVCQQYRVDSGFLPNGWPKNDLKDQQSRMMNEKITMSIDAQHAGNLSTHRRISTVIRRVHCINSLEPRLCIVGNRIVGIAVYAYCIKPAATSTYPIVVHSVGSFCGWSWFQFKVTLRFSTYEGILMGSIFISSDLNSQTKSVSSLKVTFAELSLVVERVPFWWVLDALKVPSNQLELLLYWRWVVSSFEKEMFVIGEQDFWAMKDAQDVVKSERSKVDRSFGQQQL